MAGGTRKHLREMEKNKMIYSKYKKNINIQVKMTKSLK